MESRGGDAKFFQTTKKGEIHELKAELNQINREKVKDAVKKVIAAMTVGKDVSSLFTDVVKSMQTDNIELKKLVYLYIINYARSQPDKAILIVNTFQKDAQAASPLIRALAIRTMGCIRVDRITEYLCEPLAKALKDRDPYVRKTAAICVAKLFDINKDLVEEQGFLDSLRDMVADPNPMVVANAVAALQEISEASEKDVFHIDNAMMGKLLAALNECTEWGQVFILDALARYEPSARDAEEIIERVTPRLKHANSAVAMSAVKVIMKYLNVIKNPKLEQSLVMEKLPPPLITLLSEQKSEIQYVALRNINLIVQKKPDILANGVKAFFCRYNDPIYVKMEKLEIMIKLASVKNIEKLLMEFKEYASEVDVEFVRKAVLAIGRCAIKIDKAAERCIQVLLELIQTKVNYVVQEAIIVIKDIFRKYPNRYESIIATLCENLDTLDEPEAKASMIWIIGEYSDRIDNAPELLENFIETFEEESPSVQLQLLTSIVKLFLKRPEDAKELVGQVLNLATSNADNPDLRDRGYIYWRLLSTDPEAAQAVVLAPKPTINDDTFQLDTQVLDMLIANISTLASIYHKSPEYFVKDHHKSVSLRNKAAGGGAGGKKKGEESSSEESSSESESESDSDEEDAAGPSHPSAPDDAEDDESSDESSDDEDGAPKAAKKAAAAAVSTAKASSNAPIDLLGMDLLGSMTSPTPPQQQQPAVVASSSVAAASAPSASSPSPSSPLAGGPTSEPLKSVLDASSAKGLTLRTRLIRRNGSAALDMQFENGSTQPLQQFAMKFNDNFIGLAPPPGALAVGGPIAPGTTRNVSIPLHEGGKVGNLQMSGVIQVAIKTELGVFYFNQPTTVLPVLDENGKLADQEFLQQWKVIPDANETLQTLPSRSAQTVDEIKTRLEKYNVFYVAARTVNKQTNAQALYASARCKGQVLLIEIKIEGASTQVCVKAQDMTYAQLARQAIAQILQ